MRAKAWALLALLLGGLGLWGVWPVLAEGLGAAGLGSARPLGLWSMGVQAALGLAPGACLALLACVFQEIRARLADRPGSTGLRLCFWALTGCMALALTLLLLLAGQPLRWWFLLAEPAAAGALVSSLSRTLPAPDIALGLLSGLGLLLWTPGLRNRLRGLAMAHGVVCILFFVRLWPLAQPGAASGCLEQWAGLSLSLGAAMGAVVLSSWIMFDVERG